MLIYISYIEYKLSRLHDLVEKQNFIYLFIFLNQRFQTSDEKCGQKLKMSNVWRNICILLKWLLSDYHLSILKSPNWNVLGLSTFPDTALSSRGRLWTKVTPGMTEYTSAFLFTQWNVNSAVHSSDPRREFISLLHQHRSVGIPSSYHITL